MNVCYDILLWYESRWLSEWQLKKYFKKVLDKLLRLEYDIRVVAKRQSRPLKTEQINANNQCVGSLTSELKKNTCKQ